MQAISLWTGFISTTPTISLVERPDNTIGALPFLLLPREASFAENAQKFIDVGKGATFQGIPVPPPYPRAYEVPQVPWR
jgi:hypothetical protein